MFTEDESIKKYGDIPVYAFNFVDYVLWKNRSDLKEKYSSVEFEAFKFAYRRSIEHWFPQNPNGHDGESQLPAEFLHSFGNLCIITDSQNSKFGNSYPESKLTQWKREDIFKRQSLKLQIMAAITEKTEWKSDQVLGLENEILPMINEFIGSKK